MQPIIDKIKELSTSKKLLYATGALGSIIVAKQIIQNWKIKSTYKKYKIIARNTREKRDNHLKNTVIPPHNISEKLQQKILNCSLEELKGLLDSLQVSSEQLLNFYAKRMHTIGWQLKHITESNYEAALIRAQQCDQLRKTNPKECKGELFGIVMTVKDTFELKGMASTIGCAAKVNDIAEDDGLDVKIFQNAGAIIFAKTNIPQIAMSIETLNDVWGTAENPWNTKRTTGGSSGGSGGAVAAKCTPVCYGTDIGGSIRLPSSFNGVTGLKPCTRRVTMLGNCFDSAALCGQTTVLCSAGPISRTVDDCALMMEAYLNKENYRGIKRSEKDVYINIKPWDKQEYNSTRKMKIGYYTSLEEFPASKAVQRGVLEAVEILKKLGHELVEFKPPIVLDMIDAYLKIVMSDSGKSLTDVLKGEEPLSHYTDLFTFYQSSSFFRKFVATILSLIGEKRLSDSVKQSHGIDSYEYRNITYKIQEYRYQYIELMEKNNFDCIVCPSFATVAGQHDFSKELLLPFMYASMYNLIDFAAGVVPISVVREDEQTYEDHFNDRLTKLTKNVVQDSKGMPIGVQVVTYPLEEETAMNIMKQIEREAQFAKKYPLKI